MKDFIIQIRQLSKFYGNVIALDKIDLKVEEGSVVGLIGPNGAGKTTTIKIILGLLRPNTGKVRVFNQVPWDNPDIRSVSGVVHERQHFPSHHKVQDYLERTCRIFGVPRSKALDVLELVKLEELYDRAISTLSAGNLQKFAIAHALVNEPRLVVADEITTHLDPQARSEILDLIKELHGKENVTFLISSHILPELSRVCDSVAVINQGRILASGNVRELCSKFSAHSLKISTDKPKALADIIRSRNFADEVSVCSCGIIVRTTQIKGHRLYEEILESARRIGAEILEIESSSESLEELYRIVVARSEGND